ncbi:MAG: lactaldehyde reductase [Olsenella sp.]|jgi:lactaldehyde reductase|nr:lactaldehyde reductase [Olsenella sp.]
MGVNRFVLNTVSYHGSGAIKEIPGEIKRRGLKRAFVCSDPDLVKFGVTAKVTDLLDEAGIPYTVYSEIKPNPTIQNVQDGVKAIEESGADCIVAIGGGSSMDTAKAIGVIHENPEFADVRSLEGVAPTKNHATFTIAVPTTAGTAAEVTINYVITDPERVRKFVCVDTNDIPEVAVVDPDMMASMPAGLTAATGMDALTHAIEGYTTKGAWELSDMFHYEAISLISTHLRDAYAEAKAGKPASGREGMALGQYIAGMGFSNVGLGIDHSMAHTLSAHYDTPHGVACAMLLPISMEFNKPVVAERQAKIAQAMGVDTTGMSTEEAADAAIAAVRQLSHDVEIPTTCKGLVEEDLDQLAKDALADACYPGNPREATPEQVKDMFRKIMA